MKFSSIFFCCYLTIKNISFFFLLQKISERAFDGLNNLKRLNLENNRLKVLERGLFTGVPALIFLNLIKNSLETITYNNILPLMDNLVNHTSILAISGEFPFLFYFHYFLSFIMCHNDYRLIAPHDNHWSFVSMP